MLRKLQDSPSRFQERLAIWPGLAYDFEMTSLLRISLGSIFILLGLAGLILPILQGWLFLGLGFLLLAADIPLFAKLLCWIENRYPRLRQPLDKFRRFSVRTGKEVPPCAPSED